MSDGGQVPSGIDASVVSPARVYDYLLGGHNNFAVDRIAAQKLTELSPDVPQAIKVNRAFLVRTVRFLTAEAGIRQFLDFGTGLPTKGNVPDIAQSVAPETRVVCVDNDPMVLAHARALKTGENTAVIHADLRDVATILQHPGTQRLIDFSQPLAIMFLSVLHFVPEPSAREAVAALVSAVAPGSYLVISVGHTDPDPGAAAGMIAAYGQPSYQGTLRAREDVLAFFDGLELLDPGLVPLQQWRPDSPQAADQPWLIGGIGRLPAGHVPVPVSAMPHWHAPQPPESSPPEPPPAAPGDQQPPPGIDASVATAARMYDYWLGGHNNFAADRIAALEITKRSPEAPLVARENRAFLQRAIRFLAGGAGIRQFLDLGTGLPTKGNIHQVAQAIDAGARVVYVDNDPMVLAHARALKTGERAAVIQADLRDVDAVLGHPDTRRLIDFSQPLAVFFLAVLHFIVDDGAAGSAVSGYLSAAAPGSYLVLSHGNSEADPEAAAAGMSVYARTANPIAARSRAEILEFFDGLELLEPGLVPLRQWRPDGPGAAELKREWAIGGIGRKLA